MLDHHAATHPVHCTRLFCQFLVVGLVSYCNARRLTSALGFIDTFSACSPTICASQCFQVMRIMNSCCDLCGAFFKSNQAAGPQTRLGIKQFKTKFWGCLFHLPLVPNRIVSISRRPFSSYLNSKVDKHIRLNHISKNTYFLSIFNSPVHATARGRQLGAHVKIQELLSRSFEHLVHKGGFEPDRAEAASLLNFRTSSSPILSCFCRSMKHHFPRFGCCVSSNCSTWRCYISWFIVLIQCTTILATLPSDLFLE